MMLTIEDAVNVAKRIFDVDPEDEEWLFSEFEQKCYLESADPEQRILEVIDCINAKEICDQIIHDQLSDWCEGMRAEFEMAFSRMKGFTND